MVNPKQKSQSNGRAIKGAGVFSGIRDEILPFPVGRDCKKILLLGTTGAGKTTLLRQLIGTSKSEGFPTTSTAKTTIADTEIVVAKGDYEAAVTFMTSSEVQMHLEECLSRALIAACEKESPDTVSDRLLEHRDQRLRFNYILGEEGDFLSGVVGRIHDIANEVNTHLRGELDVRTEKDRDAFESLLEEELSPQNNAKTQGVADDMMAEIRKRFAPLEGPALRKNKQGWPECWHFSSPDRKTFLENVRPFASNHSDRWGELLTPIVNGMRIRGPFAPRWWPDISQKFVIVDGEGLGHVLKNVSSATISTKHTRQMTEADAIVLVDNAAQPMQPASASVLMDAFLGGTAHKLFVCFTHMDHVEGDNLPNFRHKKRHVQRSAENVIGKIAEELGSDAGISAKRVLNGRIREFCFVGGVQETLDHNKEADKETIGALSKLMRTIFEMPDMASVPLLRFVDYDEDALRKSISGAVVKFRNDWRDFLYAEHWTRVKALSRRLAEDWDDEYDTLKPLADLGKGIQDAVYKSVQLPTEGDVTDEERDQQVAAFLRGVRAKIAELVQECVWVASNPHKQWEDGYAQKGPGSATTRRDIILGILGDDKDTPSPGPASEAFANAVVQIVKDVAEAEGETNTQ